MNKLKIFHKISVYAIALTFCSPSLMPKEAKAEDIKPLYDSWREYSNRRGYDRSNNIAIPSDPAYTPRQTLPIISGPEMELIAEEERLRMIEAFEEVELEHIQREKELRQRALEASSSKTNNQNHKKENATSSQQSSSQSNQTSSANKTNQSASQASSSQSSTITQDSKASTSLNNFPSTSASANAPTHSGPSTHSGTQSSAEMQYYEDELRVLRTPENTAEARERARQEELRYSQNSRSIPSVSGTMATDSTLPAPILIDPNYVEVLE